MISFGTPTPTVEKTRVIRHLCVKSFVPVFERTEMREVYKYPTGANFEKTMKKFPLYERWGGYWWNVTPTSKPSVVWAIARARRARVGQLKLL